MALDQLWANSNLPMTGALAPQLSGQDLDMLIQYAMGYGQQQTPAPVTANLGHEMLSGALGVDPNEAKRDIDYRELLREMYGPATQQSQVDYTDLGAMLGLDPNGAVRLSPEALSAYKGMIGGVAPGTDLSKMWESYARMAMTGQSLPPMRPGQMPSAPAGSYSAFSPHEVFPLMDEGKQWLDTTWNDYLSRNASGSPKDWASAYGQIYNQALTNYGPNLSPGLQPEAPGATRAVATGSRANAGRSVGSQPVGRWETSVTKRSDYQPGKKPKSPY